MYAALHAQSFPDQPLFVMGDSGISLTYAEYERRCNRLAHLFRELRLRRADHVAFLMENNLRLLEAEGAAERTGLYYTCINSYLSVEEAAYIVNDSRSEVCISSAAKAAVAAELPARCPAVRRWLIVDVPAEARLPEGFERYEEVVAGFPSEPVDDEQLGAAMLYSSGTTGQPKGILRPLPDIHPASPLPIMEFATLLYHFREGMTYLSPAPLYHSAPQASVSLAVRLGGTAVIMERFDAARFLELVDEYAVTHSQMVPTMFSRLLRLPAEVRERADLSSLEAIIHAAAPCPVPVKEQIIEWFGPIVIEYYGATEANGFTQCNSEEWLAHRGTVGRPVLGELHILDDDGAECPVGTPGTVWFKGATNFEYFNAPEKTQESRDPSGTTSTVGDVGYVDADGFLYLTDRKTYMIISGGVNIYPQETENLLITHPKVFDAAVIGVPNEDLGEEVKAIVQLMPGVEPGPGVERELIGFCAEHLAGFKCPRSVDFEDELPRLPTGKLYKRLLRDRYWAGHQTRIV
jgi:long-chain acyl-CoA synthetase